MKVRRERDPQRRRDVYVIDDETLYHSIVTSTRHTLDSAQATMAAAETCGPDSPPGAAAGQGSGWPGQGHSWSGSAWT
jgi:hypothetical protein